MNATAKSMRLIHALADMSFTEFITPEMVRLLYVLALLVIGVGGGWLAVGALDQPLLIGLGILIAAALLTLFAAIVVRVWLEIAVIFFRIADHTAETAEHAAEVALNTGRSVADGSSLGLGVTSADR